VAPSRVAAYLERGGDFVGFLPSLGNWGLGLLFRPQAGAAEESTALDHPCLGSAVCEENKEEQRRTTGLGIDAWIVPRQVQHRLGMRRVGGPLRATV